MDKLQELRQRLADISASIETIQASAGENEYSDEQLAQLDTHSTDFDKLSKQLEAAEKAEAIKAKTQASAGRKTTPVVPTTTTQANAGASRSDKFGGFESAGSFLMAVKKAGLTGEIDPKFKSLHKESVGEDGGFLVPEGISEGILKKINGDESLMSRTNTLQVAGNNLTLNVDENAPWNGGVTAAWTGEGKQIAESKTNFKQASWRLHKLACMLTATDELLEDATALESHILASVPGAFVHQLNKAILTGNGVGKPLGIINSPFTVTVAKDNAQAADTVSATNILNMYARQFPGSVQNAAWFIHPQVQEQLRVMRDPAGNYIYLAPGSQMNQTPYSTLLGLPVIPLMAGMPALGDLGDIVLADLSYYTMIRKAAGIKAATSIHMYFDKEITAFRFSLRVDGKCPYQSPVTTENGGYAMSAFVQLEAR